MKQLALIAAAFLAVAVCSTAYAKEYRAAEAAGAPGYFNVIDQGFWVVGYTGEPGQSNREVAEYALKRAADLAAEQQQEWFAVLSTTNRMVRLGVPDDLQTRAGAFMGDAAGVGNTVQGGGGAPSANSSGNTGSFGGEAVPNAVLERWQPRRVRQTLLVIELGSGDEASFPGLDHEPEIFPASQPEAASAEPEN
jgi:hypothetical protein